MRAVNHELLALYLEIGEAIYRKQEELGWGKSVVKTLAHDLQTEFPGRNGFSAQNLWLMRQFYREYLDLPKLQPLVREISWAKNLVILARCKDPLQREFYLRATARFGWTKAVLQHQIDNQSYEKYLLNQTNFDQALPETIKAQAVLAPAPPRPLGQRLVDVEIRAFQRRLTLQATFGSLPSGRPAAWVRAPAPMLGCG